MTRLGHREFMGLPLRERLALRHENRSNVYAWQEAIEAYEKDRADALEEIERLWRALEAAESEAERFKDHAEDHATRRVQAEGKLIARALGHVPIGSADRIEALEAAVKEAREALTRARFHVFTQNEAEHMMDGFGPRSYQPSDDALDGVDSTIVKLDALTEREIKGTSSEDTNRES